MDFDVFFLAALSGLLGLLILWPKLVARAAPVKILDEASREAIWVDLKKQILLTSAYTNEVLYERLYKRCTELLIAFMTRHQHYAIGIEAKWGERGAREISQAFLTLEREHAAALQYYCINSRLDLRKLSDELVLYMCWFSYVGGRSKYLPGPIMSDRRFLQQALDYLILERSSIDAAFFKGFVLKYGLSVYGKPDIERAREYLEKAAKNGAGAAALELQYLDIHTPLETIASVHVEDDRWNTESVSKRKSSNR